MGMTNAGLTDHVKKWIGESTSAFNYSNAHIGIGNSNTGFASSQTDLQGASTKRKGMESAFPSRDPDSDGSDNKVRFKAIFGTTDANFRWEEWGIFNSSSGGTMHSREVEYIGEKTNKASWTFSIDITLT